MAIATKAKSIAFTAIASLFAIAPAAHADLTGLTLSGGTTNNDFGGTVGFSFTVGAQNVSVTQLGYYNGPGFLASGATHQVAIYNDATQALVGSVATVTGTSTTVSAAANGQFAFVAVTPFTLNANTIYDVAASNLSGSATTTGNQDYLIKATGASTGTDITYGTSRFSGNSSTVVYPASTFSNNDVGNIGGNFQYTVVPEPASIAMVFGAAIVALGRRRCKVV